MHYRCAKSTHISMISNAVTYLRSYTNTAITKNSTPILLVTPCNRRRRRADVSASSADIVASNDKCFLMFHNVLRVFHDALLVVHDVILCITMFYMFHDVLLCLTMFSKSCNNRRPPQGSRQRLRDRDNTAGIGDNSAEISDDATWIVDITTKVIPC